MPSNPSSPSCPTSGQKPCGLFTKAHTTRKLRAKCAILQAAGETIITSVQTQHQMHVFISTQTHSHTAFQITDRITGGFFFLVWAAGASPSTALPQAAVVFLLQPSNRWSKQPFANTTKSHTIIMIGHSLFCFGSYFPIGLARGNPDCCDCSDCALL